MALFENREFKDQLVELDGNIFRNCVIDHCVVTYRGGDPPYFEGCTFTNNMFQLEDGALRALRSLHVLYASGMQDFVERIIQDIRTGPPSAGPSTVVH